MLERTFTLQNEWWQVELALDSQLRLLGLRRAGTPAARGATAKLFCTITGADAAGAPPVELLSAHAQEVRLAVSTVEIVVSLDGPALRWRVERAEDGADAALSVCFPFLAEIFAPAAGERLITGAESFVNGAGARIFRHADWPLPIARLDESGQGLTLLVDAPAGFAATHLWDVPGLPLQANASPLFQAELLHVEGGWPAVFAHFRQRIRSRFNLAEYERADLAWYSDQFVQHFTFLYGREILDLERGDFNLDRFLNEGEALFGGYDGFLIWGVYPRIGVDERTQFDFYDDFPGGRAALQEMGRQARARGTRFFVPYKPWDRSADWHAHGPNAAALREIHEHSRVPAELQAALHAIARQDAERLAQLVLDVEADGVFLDTMSAINRAFRDEIDSLRPGVVLCSEGRAKGAAFEMITSSWDQSPNRDGAQGNWSAAPETMPGVDLYRFIFPEHRLLVINRHAVGDDRLHIIQRGFFNGMGWVVWQDIFGLVLTYAPDEAALLKKCATLLRQHRRLLSTPSPTPLLETETAAVYANLFPGENKRLWTFYNENAAAVDGPVLQVTPRPDTHFVDIWNGRELGACADGLITLKLAAHATGAVVEFPRLIQRAAGRLTLPDGVNAVLQVTPLGLAIAPRDVGQSIDVASLLQSAQPACLVQAVADGEVLDQTVIVPDGDGA